MVVAGLLIAAMGIAYWFLTQDLPAGDYVDLRRSGLLPPKQAMKGAFAAACRDRRVWALAGVYAACFGIELTVDNVIALYFVDYFDGFKQMGAVEAVRTAGLFASMFGLMHLFARTLGGYISDRTSATWGLSGRVKWLFLALFGEGLTLMLFSQMRVFAFAIPSLLFFGLFMKMSEGATYSIVPFINKRRSGSGRRHCGSRRQCGSRRGRALVQGTNRLADRLLHFGDGRGPASFLSFAVTFDRRRSRNRNTSAQVRRAGLGSCGLKKSMTSRRVHRTARGGAWINEGRSSKDHLKRWSSNGNRRD